MELVVLPYDLTVCKVASGADLAAFDDGFYFVAQTDEESSLVCKTELVPPDTLAREDGWRAFRIQGVLDFSLVGILAKLLGVLADAGIGIFAASTFNTDYILVKEEQLDRALDALAGAGYTIA